MTDNIYEILDQRNKTHGKFDIVAKIYNQFKKIISDGSYPEEVILALDMICMKLARIVSSSGCHLDDWTDIAGYAELARRGVEKLQGKDNA